jgi:type II secretory pathway pseudopilin PulG
MKFSQPGRCWNRFSYSFPSNRCKAGFTVIELLVISAIIGLALMLLLPVLQHTRETARRMQCFNHIKEMALACAEHQATLHHFPTGGWPGPTFWMGDPDCGYGKRQPGGWTYNILPFLENKALHDWGRNKSPAEKKAISAKRAQTPLDIYYCPSRRLPTLYPISSTMGVTYPNMNPVSFAARTDYAANGRLQKGLTIIYANSIVSIKEIRDGLSHTYLIGEKNLMVDHYKDGAGMGDTLPVYGNSSWDWERSGNVPPARDRRGHDNSTAFGSAHPIGFNISFCDGSACTIKYDIEPVMHQRLSDRSDGKPAVIP